MVPHHQAGRWGRPRPAGAPQATPLHRQLRHAGGFFFFFFFSRALTLFFSFIFFPFQEGSRVQPQSRVWSERRPHDRLRHIPRGSGSRNPARPGGDPGQPELHTRPLSTVSSDIQVKKVVYSCRLPTKAGRSQAFESRIQNHSFQLRTAWSCIIEPGGGGEQAI